MRTLLIPSLVLALIACEPNEVVELDTATEEAALDEAEAVELEEDEALLAQDALEIEPPELPAFEEGEETGDVPPPPSTGDPDCDTALYAGNIGATYLDQAASHAWRDYLAGGANTNAWNAYNHLESAKISAWRGYWALSRSCDESSALSNWNSAQSSSSSGQYWADLSCDLGRSNGCRAQSAAKEGWSYLGWAQGYAYYCSC